MLVLNRFVVPPDAHDAFAARAHAALAALAERPGYLSGRLTRALDATSSLWRSRFQAPSALMANTVTSTATSVPVTSESSVETE